jgi:hypothetical protein
VTDKARILRKSLHSAATLTPLITVAATRAAYGSDQAARHHLGEALRHARQLVTELELQQLQLDRMAATKEPA